MDRLAQEARPANVAFNQIYQNETRASGKSNDDSWALCVLLTGLYRPASADICGSGAKEVVIVLNSDVISMVISDLNPGLETKNIPNEN